MTLPIQPHLPDSTAGNSATAPPLRTSDRLLDLVHRVGRCHRQLRRLLNEGIHDSRINDTALLVLWFCAGADDAGVPQREMAAAADVSPAQISGLLERLRQAGWLVSKRLEGDRRQQVWQLTPAGQRVYSELCQALEPIARRLAAQLSGPGNLHLTRLLQRLQAGVERPDLRAFDPADENHTAWTSQGDAR